MLLTSWLNDWKSSVRFSRIVRKASLRSRRSRARRAEPKPVQAAEVLEDRVMLSVTPTIVKDINTKTETANPNLVEVDGITFFAADDGQHGRELWKSDGTKAGTVLVKDIFPGLRSSSPTGLTAVNGTLFFMAFLENPASTTNNRTGWELWKSDGTEAGTVLVKDINPGGSSSFPFGFTDVNGTLFFRADDGEHGRELWKSDGTEAGTVLVKDILPGGSPSSPARLTDVNGTLFFTADDGEHGTELWKSDGTEAGTVLVKDINPGRSASSPDELLDFGGTLLFTADNGEHGRELWTSDGTETGTVMVTDLRPASDSSRPVELTPVGGTLFFTADDGTNGRELWKSDGTEAGTVLVKDIYAGRFDATLRNLTDVGGTLFFNADDGTNGRELWKSDGTEAGTVLVKDIRPGSDSSRPSPLADVNGTLFFAAFVDSHGRELWKSDGTEEGTVMVKNIRSAAIASSNPSRMLNVNGTLIFTARDGEHGRELWRSDGTEAGTTLIKDVNANTRDSMAFINSSRRAQLVGGEPVAIGDTLFFVADDDDHGRELWKSDGTEAGTVLLKDIAPGRLWSTPEEFVNVNGALYFTAVTDDHGRELWKSDGTEAGTVLVKDILPGSSSSEPRELTNVEGTLFFSADGGTNGRELWRSDGTAEGTVIVKDILPDDSSSAPAELTNVGGTLFFGADEGTNGRELWKSDGTEAGTVLVEDIFAGSSGSDPKALVDFGGTLFFSADDGDGDLDHGRELWTSDGTVDGTIMVKDVRPGPGSSGPKQLTEANGTLFFWASTNVGGALWKSDGTEEGTVMVKNIQPAAIGSSNPSRMLNVNGTLFFTARDGEHGGELWKSDGTEEGTLLVKNIATGSSSSTPVELTNVDGTLFFSARQLTTGRELWRSDGTEEGTQLVHDIKPGDGVEEGGAMRVSSMPIGLTTVGNTLFFAANDGRRGFEIWTLAFDDNTAPLATDDSYTVNEDTTLSVAAPGVLEKDSDADGDTLTAVKVTEPSQGTLTLNSDGSFTYEPDENFHGEDSFTYKADDGTVDSNEATVTITVNPVNDAPVASVDSYTVDEDTTLSVAVADGVLDNDSDVDGDSLSAVLVDGPSHGSLTLNSEGDFTYEPDADFNGSDSFTYKANDGDLGSNVATVEITVNPVNDAPVAESTTLITDEDTAVEVDLRTLAGDVETVDNDLSFAVSDAVNGTIELLGDGHTARFTPDGDFNGPASFGYSVTDTGDGSDGPITVGPVTIDATVNPVNDAPMAESTTLTTDEDTAVEVDLRSLVEDVETDDVDLSFELSDPANGSVQLVDGHKAVFTPDPDFNDLHGEAGFKYSVTDTGDGEAPAITVGPVAIQVDVYPVNDAPAVEDQSFSIEENSLNGTTVGTVAAGDVDIVLGEGQSLTYEITAGNESGAFAIDPETGEISVADSAPLDHESTPIFMLTVEVTDDGEPSSSDTATITVELLDVEIPIDIRPGKEPNTINLKSHGKVPVAILSTADFDATQVDPETLTFGPTGTEESLFRKGNGKPHYQIKDVNDDGLLDLVARFQIQQTGFRGSDTEGILMGRLIGGGHLEEGRDSVEIVNPPTVKQNSFSAFDTTIDDSNDRADDDAVGRSSATLFNRQPAGDPPIPIPSVGAPDEGETGSASTFLDDGRDGSDSAPNALDVGTIDAVFEQMLASSTLPILAPF